MAAACLCDPEPKNWEIDVIEDKHCVRTRYRQPTSWYAVVQESRFLGQWHTLGSQQ